MVDRVNAPAPRRMEESRSTLGLILDGGLARRLGGADKGLVPLAGRPMMAHVDRAASPAMRGAGDQRQRRSGAVRRFRPAGPRRRSARFRRAARRRSGGARTLRPHGAEPGPCCEPCRPIRRSHPTTSSPGCMRRGAPQGRRSPSPPRAAGRIMSPRCGRSRSRPTCAARSSRRACARSRNFEARFPLALAEWPAAPVDPFFNVNSPEDLARAEEFCSGL